MEIHHIEQAAEGGTNDADNAIPVCFDCHAEVNHYNLSHPRGRKYSAAELKGHREEWIRICAESPHVFDAAVGRSQAGPLEALLDELDFNIVVARHVDPTHLGCRFLDIQFRRAIEYGTIALLDSETKSGVLNAYISMGRANYYLDLAHTSDLEIRGRALSDAQDHIVRARTPVFAACSAIRRFLDLAEPQPEAPLATYKRPMTPSSVKLLELLSHSLTVFAQYERIHEKGPLTQHHELSKAMDGIRAWHEQFDSNPPPGIRSSPVWTIRHAWAKVMEVAKKRPEHGVVGSSLAAEYLAVVQDVRVAIQGALSEYREILKWQ